MTEVFWLPSEQYVTQHARIWLAQPLEMGIFSKASLLASLLRRGTQRYPSQRKIVQALEALWGAEMHTQVSRIGGAQVTALSLQLPDGRYVPQAGSGLLAEGISLLAELISQPYLPEGLFEEASFAQEKNRLQAAIENRKNQRAAFAQQRLNELIYAGSALATPRSGSVEEVLLLSNQDMVDFYHQTRKNSVVIVGLCGNHVEDLNREQAEALVSWNREPKQILPLPAWSHRNEVKQVREVLPGEQSQLLLAFSSEVAYSDSLNLPLSVFNGLFGAFAHSRLFRTVREEEGLAYATGSRLDRSTGVITAYAGLEAEQAELAKEKMMEELQNLQQGDFSEEELDMTRQTLCEQLRGMNQEAEGRLDFRINQFLMKHGDAETLMAQIQAIGKEDVVNAAQRVRLHTTYLLADGEGM